MKALSEAGIQIKTAFRYVSLTAGGFQPTLWPMASGGTSTFVESLLRRYQRHARQPGNLDTILRRVQLSHMAHPAPVQIQLHLAPRLALTSLKHFQLASSGARRRSELKREERTQIHLLQKTLLQPVTSVRFEHLMQRLIIGRVRIEPSATPYNPASTTSQVNSAVVSIPPLVPLVVRRPDAAIAAEEGAYASPSITTHRNQQWGPVNGKTHTNSQRAPTEPAAPDINHLTDEVIRAIDRRIIAQRERFGRI